MDVKAGDVVSVGALGSGVRALFFFKVDCPTCARVAPAVERLRRAYAPLEVLAVAQDPEPLARAWAEQCGLEARLVSDSDGFPASTALGLEIVPTLVLLDAAGRVAAFQEGWSRAGYAALAAQAAQLLGVPPVPIAPVDGPAFVPG